MRIDFPQHSGRSFFWLSILLLSASRGHTFRADDDFYRQYSGTVTDPSGAFVSGAKVTIANQATGQTINFITNSSGTYNSGALTPGDYKVQVAAKGFSSVSLPVTVQVGKYRGRQCEVADGPGKRGNRSTSI